MSEQFKNEIDLIKAHPYFKEALQSYEQIKADPALRSEMAAAFNIPEHFLFNELVDWKSNLPNVSPVESAEEVKKCQS